MSAAGWNPSRQAIGQNNLAEVLTGVAVVIGIVLLLLFI